jgi:hypothetical protein
MKPRLSKSFISPIAIMVSLLLSISAFPQSSSESIRTSATNVATPNVAALLANYMIPVNYYRGLPEINVPLHSIKLNGMEVPVSLSYDASGVRVLQAPTWAGLSWSLNTGGAITRVVNGIRDEYPGAGYIYNQNSATYLVEENALNTVTTTFAPNTNAWNTTRRIYIGADTGPDEFQFVFNGISGKFYLDRLGNVITDSKYKIEYVLATVFPGNPYLFFTSFTITAEDGTKYFFNSKESHDVTTYGPLVSSPPGDSYEDVSWYLVSIESPDGLTKINLDYNAICSSCAGRLLDHRSAEKYKATTVSGSSVPIRELTYYISQVRQGANFLSKIYTDTEEIVFETVDHNAALMRKKLDKIRIRDKVTGKEWYYRFTYVGYGAANHFLLENIYRGSASGEEIFYQFNYNLEPMPWANGNADQFKEAGIDHWGYYNGPKAPYKSLVPSGVSMVRTDGQTVSGTSRNPSPNYTRAGSLESIILPTRGRISLEFENNDYGFVGSSPLASTKFASGLRIKKIIYKDDNDDANDVVKTYSYTSEANPFLSSGAIPFEPVYNYDYVGSNFASTFWMNWPILPINIGYSRVVETNGDGSKTIYKYNSAIEYPPTADVGEIGAIVHVNLAAMDFKLSTVNNNPYLLTDNVNTHLRGLLREKTLFDQNGNTLQKSEYTYQSWNVGRLFSYKSNIFDFSIALATQNPPGFRTVIFLMRNYVNINRAELSSESVKHYKLGDGSNPFTITKNFQYNGFYFTREIEETRSDYKQIKHHFTYPTDYNSSTMGGNIGTLLNLKARGLVIETLKSVNGKLVEGSVNEYDYLARPTKVFNLETDGSIGYSPSLLNPNNHLSLPSNYREKSVFRYNNGRLAEVSDYGFANSWQWGYSNSRVISKTISAPYSASFYTSFEDDGSLDSQAKTGQKTMATPFTFTPNSWFSPVANSKLSYWFWNGQWNFKEVDYAGGSYVITDGSKIDELRIHPKGSLMTTYVHDISNGLSAVADPNGITKSFEYDHVGRLLKVRDYSNNLITQFTYRYKNP